MQTDTINQDVKERDNIFVVEIELPTYCREDIEARFYAGYLTVFARKPQDRGAAGFKKAFYIGRDVSQEHIRAAFHNGILKFMIPKDVESTQCSPAEIEIM